MSFAVHIQANLEDDLVKEALRTVRNPRCNIAMSKTLFTAVLQQWNGG